MSDDIVFDTPVRDVVSFYARHPEKLEELVAARERGETLHFYRSTACTHGLHEHCRVGESYSGLKLTSRCEFCGTSCFCGCHGP